MPNERLWVAASDQLAEGSYLRTEVAYTGEPVSVIVFRHKGRCLAYRNRCVHMPRQLDCEKDGIFDATGQYLRCSMHGIVYDPVTGASVSSLCNGQRLTPIGIFEDPHGVWIDDMRVKPLTRKQQDLPE
ncbi:MAG: Rieske 2Fe-2S domain-containing protein [Thiobacillus sp.]|nr:Rieske 2Fe-2S domain-containing protein [Thiobacillus sp.]